MTIFYNNIYLFIFFYLCVSLYCMWCFLMGESEGRCQCKFPSRFLHGSHITEWKNVAAPGWFFLRFTFSFLVFSSLIIKCLAITTTTILFPMYSSLVTFQNRLLASLGNISKCRGHIDSIPSTEILHFILLIIFFLLFYFISILLCA